MKPITSPLWVIDNGAGMGAAEFFQEFDRDPNDFDKWSPNFKEPETFRLWNEANRSMQFLSTWESGKEPLRPICTLSINSGARA